MKNHRQQSYVHKACNAFLPRPSHGREREREEGREKKCIQTMGMGIYEEIVCGSDTNMCARVDPIHIESEGTL
jgi:hypothetical protein